MKYIPNLPISIADLRYLERKIDEEDATEIVEEMNQKMQEKEKENN